MRRGRQIRGPGGLAALATLVAWLAAGATGGAQTIYETAALGPSGQTSGLDIRDDSSVVQYVGARFQVTTPVKVYEVGGNLSAKPGVGNQEIFAALVGLADGNSFPQSGRPLDGPDVLATTTLALPAASADVSAPIGPVDLTPGWYALVFGSGQFGASGWGLAATDNPSTTNPSFIFYNGAPASGRWAQAFDPTGIRMFVAVPEPTGALAPLLTLAAMLRRRRL